MNNIVELDKESLISKTLKNGILIIQFNHPHYNNPFGTAIRSVVIEALLDAEEDPNVSVVILTGGIDRSFSVGEDFNEAKDLCDSTEIKEMIDGSHNLFLAGLKLTKPSIAAIDRYAIGLGLQLSLTCDWRIGTDRAKLFMPELKSGMACTFGQYMLEKQIGRENMLEIVYSGEPVPLSKCIEYKLFHQVTDKEHLMEQALAKAEQFLKYPKAAFRSTKKVINYSYIKGMNEIADMAKEAHQKAFADPYAITHMRKIVDKK